MSDEGCTESFVVSSNGHSTFSVKTLLPAEEIRERVSRIFVSEAIIHEQVARLGDVTGDDAVVVYLDSNDADRAAYISSKAFPGRALFLIVPPDLEPTACAWWEKRLIADFVTTDHLRRLPAAIRRHFPAPPSPEFFNPMLQWEGLNRVVKSILDAVSLDAVFKVATEEIARFLQSHRAVIVQYHADGGFWRHEAEFRLDPDLSETIGFTIPDTGNPFAAELKMGKVVQVPDTASIADAINIGVAERFPGAWLLVPIPVGETVWGSLSLLRGDGENPWREKEISAATTLADNLGIAIKQGQLYNQLQNDFEERNHLYQALRESENRFRTVIGSSPLPFSIKDLEGRFLYINRACERMIGVREENLIGRKMEDLVPAYQASRSHETDRLVTKVGEPRIFEERRDLPTGSFELQVMKFPLADEFGTVHSICTIIEDITSKKKLISDLKLSENRYRLLASAFPDTLIRFSAAWECLDFISPSGDFFPGIAERIPGSGISELGFPPDLTERILATCREATKTREVLSFEYPLKTQESLRWFEIRVTSSLSGDSILIIRDVSERLEFIEALKAREDQLRLLETAIDNAEDVILITDTALRKNPGQHILYVNRTFERLTGYTREEVIGKTPRILQGPGTLPETRKVLSDAIANWESVTVEVLNYRKDGTEFWSELSIVPLCQSDGIHSHWVSVQRDITERKRTELTLRQSQKMEAIGQLTSGVAHNFNNILMIISGHAQLLDRSLEAGTKEKRQLSTIQSAVNRGAELVRQLMAYSRVGELRTGIVNIGEKIEETVSLIEKVLPTNLDIRVEIPEEAVLVLLDGEKFSQCVLNLAVNARDAMPEGGTLRFRGHVHRQTGRDSVPYPLPPGFTELDLFVLEVADTGIGMSPEIKERIFEPFFTTKEIGNGTGLGLASVFGFITESKGTIHVESALSVGTTFWLYFPITDAPARTIPKIEAPLGSVDFSGLRVLLVEDEPQTRILFREMLQNIGFQVEMTGNGVEALEIAQRFDIQIDLLVTDWIMPKMGGKAFLDLFTHLHPSTPIVVVTGTPNLNIARERAKSKIHLLPKPFTKSEMEKTIQMALSRGGRTA